MPGYMGIKACFWLFFCLTVCPGTIIAAAFNVIVPFQSCCQKTVRSSAKEVESGTRNMDNAIVDYTFQGFETVTQAVKGYFEKRTEYNLLNVILGVLDSSSVILWMHSASSLYLTGFSPLEFVKLVSASFWPFLMTPVEEKIAPPVLKFDKMYLEKFWRFFNLREEEEKLPLPPPEESLLDKMAKRILPGTNMKNFLNYFKDLQKIIRERTGYILIPTVSIIILSAFITTVITQVYGYLADVPEEKNFTDEELMEEYDFTPEFRNTFYEWLTPSRHIKYTAEDDGFMDEMDFDGNTFDESDYRLARSNNP